MSEITDEIMEEVNNLFSSLITPFHFGYNRSLEDSDKEKLAKFIQPERQRFDSLKALCDDMAKKARCEALDEAAQVAERLGSHLVRGESGPEYVGGNLDVAAAIRALSESSPNPLPEQRDNIGREGE